MVKADLMQVVAAGNRFEVEIVPTDLVARAMACRSLEDPAVGSVVRTRADARLAEFIASTLMESSGNSEGGQRSRGRKSNIKPGGNYSSNPGSNSSKGNSKTTTGRADKSYSSLPPARRPSGGDGFADGHGEEVRGGSSGSGWNWGRGEGRTTSEAVQAAITLDTVTNAMFLGANLVIWDLGLIVIPSFGLILQWCTVLVYYVYGFVFVILKEGIQFLDRN